MEFTLGDESEDSKKKELSSAELTKQLERLIHEKADNQRIFDWVEVCTPASVSFVVFEVFLPPYLFTIFTSDYRLKVRLWLCLCQAHDFIF